MILVGNGAIRTHAAADVAAFARQRKIPVVHTFMGKGIVSDADPLSWGAIGLLAHDLVIDAMDTADLILAVGYDLVEYAPSNWNSDRGRPIIHIDALPAEVDEDLRPGSRAGRRHRADAACTARTVAATTEPLRTARDPRALAASDKWLCQ